MATPELNTTIHEVNNVSSDLDIELFRGWQRGAPGFDCVRAEVDRYNGLTLYTAPNNGYTTGLHFSCSLCGYTGMGPVATAIILEEAGFGTIEALEEIIYNQQSATFTR